MRPPVGQLRGGGEGMNDASSEANFEKTKVSKQGPASIGGRRFVVVAGEHRVCGPWSTRSKLTHFRQRRWQSSQSRTLAWQRSTFLTKKATVHLRWCSLLATAAVAAVASASSLVAAAAVAAEDIGVGLTACGRGVLIRMAISPAQLSVLSQMHWL